MNSRMFAAIALWPLFVGCGLLKAPISDRLEFEEMPKLPDDWGRYSEESDYENGCPSVAGTYQLIADLVEQKDGQITKSESSRFDYFSLFIGPLRATNGATIASDGRDTLVFIQPDARTLILRAPAPDNHADVTYSLSIGGGQLECKGGFFELPREETYSAVEGTTLNYQAIRRFTSLGDGSLVYYEQYGKLKGLPGQRGLFTHRLYRFRRDGNS